MVTETLEWSQPDDSPLAKYLKIEQRADAEGATCRVTVDSVHVNPNGSFHGGAMFAMIDLAMGIATSTQLEPNQICATSEIHIRYLRPVFEGTVEVTATVVDPGDVIVQLEAKAVDGNGKLVASATGSFVVLEHRRQVSEL